MKTLFYSILFFSTTCLAQENWPEVELSEFSDAVLEADSKVDIDNNYAYLATYRFYNDHTTTEVAFEDKNMFITLGGKELYMTQLGRTIVQNESLYVICDTVLQTIAISAAKPELFNRRSLEDFTSFLSSEIKVKKKIDGSRTKFYVEFPSPSKYLAIELWLKKDGTVDKYITYGRQELLDDSSGEDKILKPRMEISYTNYQFGEAVKSTEMIHVSDYISTDGQEITLNPKYEGYELIDLRIPTE